jgi:hypothetical protein
MKIGHKKETMIKTAGMILSASILLYGCAGSSANHQKPANVTSNPSGAEVYADGKKLGVTPLRYKLYKAFPASWKDAMYQAHGVLTVKLDDCNDFTLEINDYILSNPVHAELECNMPGKSISSATDTQEKNKSMVAPAVKPVGVTEQRLKELEGLYSKGVITKDEYNATRERILSEH